MNYQTKFSTGDKVWGVTGSDFHRIVKCKPCHNTGKVVIGDEELICPKCNGRSTHTQYTGQKFYISTFDSEVGQVRIEDTSLEFKYSSDDGPNPEITYMIRDTGVRSGQVWKEANLFASEDEAQKYCDQKNGLLLTDECGHGSDVIDRYGRVIQ